jgi:hypothetical protein
MATFYLDPEGGNDANSGTTFANRWKSVTNGATAARIAPGDTIRVMASRTPGSIGDVTFTNGSADATLASAKTLTIWNGDATAYTGVSANVTTSNVTANRKIGARATTAVTATAFTTGKIAYYTLPSTVDASAYQQISLIVRVQGAVLTAGLFEVWLCSDAIGDTFVHKIPVTVGSAITFTPNVWDSGGALSSNINSISLQALTDYASCTHIVQNIIACKAPDATDLLTHLSLIRDPLGNLYPVQTIDGTTVRLGRGNSGLGSSDVTTRNFVGTTGAVACDSINPIIVSNFITAAQRETTEAGTLSAPFTWSGGWNRTDMSTQDTGAETWWSTRFAGANAFDLRHTFQIVERMSFSHTTSAGLAIAGDTHNVIYRNAVGAVGNQGAGVFVNSSTAANLYQKRVEIDVDQISRNGENGYSDNNATRHLVFKARRIEGNSIGVLISNVSRPQIIRVTQLRNNITGLQQGTRAGSARVVLSGVETFSNGSFDVTAGTNADDLYLVDCAAPVINISTATGTDLQTRIYCQRYNRTDGDHRIFSLPMRAATDTSVTYSGSGASWRMDVLTTGPYAAIPATIPLAQVACAGGAAVTITAQVRRTNTGLTAGIRVQGMLYPGVDTGVTDEMTAAANTWEELSITFTPNEDCVVELEGYAYGGTTYSAYFDELTITQA